MTKMKLFQNISDPRIYADIYQSIFKIKVKQKMLVRRPKSKKNEKSYNFYFLYFLVGLKKNKK